MASSLTWLDHDSAARERSHRLLEMFQESDTRDELGISAIRDAIADQLFPGTSVIQTRLRYALLVPWLFIQLEDRLVPSVKFAKEAREEELRLNERLAKTDEKHVFGRSAGRELQRLASSVYWAGLGNWGIRAYRGTQQEYFRRIDSIYEARSRRQRKDDGDWLDPNRGVTWHPALRELMPETSLDDVDLKLSRDEASFVREQWKKHHGESLLAWLGYDTNSLTGDLHAEAPWLHPRQADFPHGMRTLVEHGRHFSNLVAGAALIYNLRLCEVDGRQDDAERYRDQVASWAVRVPASGLLSWDVDGFWSCVEGRGHTITARTRNFVAEWLRIVADVKGQVVDSKQARALVERREQDMKGPRSRFTNLAARAKWRGASGLVPLTYRWGITKTFLDDLSAGLRTS